MIKVIKIALQEYKSYKAISDEIKLKWVARYFSEKDYEESMNRETK